MGAELILERWCKLAGIITEEEKKGKELHVFDFDDTLGVTKSATLHVAFDYNGGDVNNPESYKPITDLTDRIGGKTASAANFTTDGITGDKLTTGADYLRGGQVVALDTDQYKHWKAGYMGKFEDPTKQVTYPDGNIEELLKKAAAKMNGKPGEIHAIDFTPSSSLGDVEPIDATLAKLSKEDGEGDVTAVVTARKGQTDMGTFGGGKVPAKNVEDIKDFLGDEIGMHPDYVFGAADFGNNVADKKREIIRDIVAGQDGKISDIFFYDDDKKNTDAVTKLKDDDTEELQGHNLNIFNYEFAHGASPEKPSFRTKIGRKKNENRMRLKESLRRIIHEVVRPRRS